MQKKSKNMLIKVNGQLPIGVQSKDVVLHIIGVIGTLLIQLRPDRLIIRNGRWNKSRH